MITHIVFFKLKESSNENKEELKQKLLTLKEKVKVVKSLEVGVDFSKSERSYDLSLIVKVETIADLDTYANDSYHKEVISFIKNKTIDTKIVDYAN